MDTIQQKFMVQQMTKTNHILHLLLSIITAGFWVPIWILVALNNASKRSALEGGPASKVLAFLGKAGWALILVATAAVLVFAVVALLFFK